MSDSLIRDIPKIQDVLEQAKNLRNLKTLMPILGPALRLFHIDVNQIDESLGEAENLERTAQELAAIPDTFNQIFGERGWIIYDLMNLDVAKAAIKKAEAGDVDGAEDDLVEYYNDDTVEWKLRAMISVESFRPRLALAEKALLDYRELRYHACIPVVLALLDGMVNDVHEKRRGFFSENVDLQAWDSIAAHEKGLNALAKIFQTGRYKTTTDPLRVPYRNGILHGMDVGYDNRIVAAKTWAALFAARDWAVRAEQGLLEAPPAQPKTGWAELLAQLRENEETKAQLDAWKPRTICLGENVPRTGEPDAFSEGTPEHKLAEFLGFWKARNYGRMAQCRTTWLEGPVSKVAREMRYIYSSKSLKGFEFQQILDESPAISVIETKLWYEDEHEGDGESVVMARLLNQDLQGRIAVRAKPGSGWRIVNWALA